jgi:type II secretory pathway predicted ATPase ExeA
MNELKLKALLRDWEISQVELAAGVGVSKATISLLLNKDHWPRKPEKTQLQADMEVWLWTRLAEDDVYPGPEIRKELWMPVAADIHGGPDHTPEAHEDEGEQPKEPEIMLTHPEWLTDRAKLFFGLDIDPFHDDIAHPEDVYLGTDHDYALSALRDAIEGHRFVAVMGESGCGKTTIRRLFQQRHADPDKYVIIAPHMLGKDAKGPKPKPLRGEDLQMKIIRTLAPGMRVEQNPSNRDDQLVDLLTASFQQGRQHLVLIDQAHKLTTEFLVYLKELNDIENSLGLQRVCGVALLGQPELDDKLNLTTNWAAREVILRCEKAYLRTLDRGGEVEAYFKVKLGRAGKTVADVFEPDACEAFLDVLQTRNAAGECTRSFVTPLGLNNAALKAMNFTANIRKQNRKVGADQVYAALGVKKRKTGAPMRAVEV